VFLNKYSCKYLIKTAYFGPVKGKIRLHLTLLLTTSPKRHKPLLNITGIGWLKPTSTERISNDIVTIIGCHRPATWAEKGWEAVCLSIAIDIVTFIGCSRPYAWIEGGGGRHNQ
jgi:hypothetical protein